MHYTEMTASDDKRTVAFARKQIDDEIHTLAISFRALDTRTLEESRALKSIRNRLSWTYRFPSEILSEIFLFVRGDQTEFDIDWIRSTSHVCQHWRDVALACPSLWTYIFPAPPGHRSVKELLERSKMAPLVIRLTLGFLKLHHETSVALQSAMEHAPRIRELHIQAPASQMRKIFPNSIPIDAPLLETLHLSNTNYLPDPDSVYKLPQFDGATRLRRLELCKCNLHWPSPLLSELTHLKLDNLDILPTMSQLLDALKKMPNLEILDLKDCLPTLLTDASNPQPPDRVVSLPCLSFLSLCSQVLECANVLNHLSYPSNALLRLQCKSRNMTATDISSLSPVLSKMRESIRQGIENPIRYLSIEQLHPMGLRLRTWTRSAETRSAKSEDSQLEIMVRWLNYARSSERVVLRFCHALPITDIDTLYVSNVLMDVGIWLRTFGAFKGLKSIHVSGAMACGIIPALSRALDKNSASRDGHTGKSSFPGLKSLALEGVYFSIRPGLGYINANQLHACLTWRRTSNVGLDFLDLIQCYYLADAHANLLRDTVTRLECDCIDLRPYTRPTYAEEDTDTEEGP